MGKRPTASIIVIGNEILSGRTQDKNINYIARGLAEIGVELMEVRVIPDIEGKIIDTINEIRKGFDYVFTTGGIGPTHDDITSESIAKALGLEFEKNREALFELEKYYSERKEMLNEARLRMAFMPKGARIIKNPVSGAPGFNIANIYVFAGVPSIMQAMFDSVKSELRGGEKILSLTITTNLFEGDMASLLTKIQNENKDVEIGSYPHMIDKSFGVSLVLRSDDESRLNAVAEILKNMIMMMGGKIIN